MDSSDSCYFDLLHPYREHRNVIPLTLPQHTVFIPSAHACQWPNITFYLHYDTAKVCSHKLSLLISYTPALHVRRDSSSNNKSTDRLSSVLPFTIRFIRLAPPPYSWSHSAFSFSSSISNATPEMTPFTGAQIRKLQRSTKYSDNSPRHNVLSFCSSNNNQYNTTPGHFDSTFPSVSSTILLTANGSTKNTSFSMKHSNKERGIIRVRTIFISNFSLFCTILQCFYKCSGC